MDKTATPFSAADELPQSSRLVRIDGDTASTAAAVEAPDEAARRLDFFEALVGTVIEISHLSVFP